MPPEPQALANIINNIQIIAGLVLLPVLLIFFHRTGRLRQAFAFPPEPLNSLTGAHLLLVLAAFYIATLLVSSAVQAVRPITPPAATATAPATEPAASQPSAAANNDEAANLVIHGLTEVLVLAVVIHLILATFDGGLAGFGLRTNRLGRDLFWAAAGYLAFWPICAGIAEGTTWLLNRLVPWWTPPLHKVLVFLEEPGISVLWGVLAWTLAELIAPLFEEILFRGLLMNWLRSASGSVWLAIVASGLGFGMIHAPQWHLVPALASLGLLLGYLYARTGSLTLVILFHAVFNLRTLVLTAVAGQSPA